MFDLHSNIEMPVHQALHTAKKDHKSYGERGQGDNRFPDLFITIRKTARSLSKILKRCVFNCIIQVVPRSFDRVWLHLGCNQLANDKTLLNRG